MSTGWWLPAAGSQPVVLGFPAVPSTFRAPGRGVPVQEQRPLAVPFAAASGALMTAEVLFFLVVFQLQDPQPDRVTVVLILLLLGAGAGSLMVLRGRRRGWLLLTVTAVGALVALAMFALVLVALGLTYGMWAAALLSVAPVSCLVLAPRRAVREWGQIRTSPSAGGRRSAARSR